MFFGAANKPNTRDKSSISIYFRFIDNWNNNTRQQIGKFHKVFFIFISDIVVIFIISMLISSGKYIFTIKI